MNMHTIYTTNDYDMFEMKVNNRTIDNTHMKKIAESMKEKGFVGAPIEVSTKGPNRFWVEDGQHRFMAAKETNTPIDFMIVEHMNAYEISQKNSLQKKWTRSDFIDCYLHNDDGSVNYNYKRLKNICDKYGGDIIMTVVYAAAGVREGGGHVNHGNIKKGRLRITDEMFNNAIIWLDRIVEPIRELKKAGLNSRSYQNALLKMAINDVADMDELAKQIFKYSYIIGKANTMKVAVENLDIVYNYNKRNKKHFRDAMEV